MSKTFCPRSGREPAHVGSADWIVAARDRIAAVLIGLGKTAHDAEDGAQAAALKAVEMGKALEAKDNPFLYLLAVAHNHLRDRRRRDRRLGPLYDEATADLVGDHGSEALESLVAQETGNALRKAVADLDPECRRVIELYHFELDDPADAVVGTILQCEGLFGAGDRRALGLRAWRLRTGKAKAAILALIPRSLAD